MPKKSIGVGLRQARKLCQFSHKDRLAFLAEGLPIILSSAQGFWSASKQVTGMPREASVLEGFAVEEAAKALILIDAIRCPPKLISSRIGAIANWFYDHLARLIYAEAVTWKPTDIKELREYVDAKRMAHYVDGSLGEYIMPNWSIYERESRLYADVQADENGAASWHAPTELIKVLPAYVPAALRLVEAMSALGMFSLDGLRATSEVWGQVAFTGKESPSDAERLTEQLLRRPIDEGLPSEVAEQSQVQMLYNHWQLPMYDFELSIIEVSLEDLEAEQERMLWSEAGF